MKPQGIAFLISSAPGEPGGIDDDYDWHVGQAEAARRAARAATRPRSASIAARLVMALRPSIARTPEPSRRRA